jgi:arylsulfatase A-like enzyme
MNVIVLSLDTLRAQNMSCYGYRKLTTPHLDRLAAQGTLFETCISPHIPTHPAHTTLFTGQDVFVHQIVTQGGRQELDPSVPLLAELLSENGYFCAAADNMGRWFSRGFEVYEGYSWISTPEGGARKAEGVHETAFRVIDHALSQDRPWFLFLHYWDPHTPYQPPPPFSRMFYAGDEFDPDNRSMEAVWACEPFKHYFQQWMGRRDPDTGEMRRWTDRAYVNAAYDAEIAYLDAALAALWEHLEWQGLLEETLLLITSDHGEELDEHGLWYDHHGLYETNLHVPLILRGPGVPAGQRLGGLVTLLDVTPTLLDFLGLPDLTAGLFGRSLKPLLESGSSAGTTERIYLTECAWMKKRGFRTPEWKFIWETGDTPPVYGKNGPELYYLPDDPGEQHNLAPERPDLVEAFHRDMEAYLAQRQQETGRPDPLALQDITLRP